MPNEVPEPDGTVEAVGDSRIVVAVGEVLGLAQQALYGPHDAAQIDSRSQLSHTLGKLQREGILDPVLHTVDKFDRAHGGLISNIMGDQDAPYVPAGGIGRDPATGQILSVTFKAGKAWDIPRPSVNIPVENPNTPDQLLDQSK